MYRRIHEKWIFKDKLRCFTELRTFSQVSSRNEITFNDNDNDKRDWKTSLAIQRPLHGMNIGNGHCRPNSKKVRLDF